MRPRFLIRCAKAVGDWWPVVALIVGLGFILWGVVAHAEEPHAEAEPRVMTERCEAWIAWLVDGKREFTVMPFSHVKVNGAALHNIAKDCLGRAPEWLKPVPDMPPGWEPWFGPQEPPPPPKPPIEPEPTSTHPKVSI